MMYGDKDSLVKVFDISCTTAIISASKNDASESNKWLFTCTLCLKWLFDNLKKNLFLNVEK